MILWVNRGKGEKSDEFLWVNRGIYGENRYLCSAIGTGE